MRVGAADPELACHEHVRFVRALRACGAEVLQLPFLHGAFDSVFVKDAALVVEDGVGVRPRVLPATAATVQRAGEAAARVRQLAHAGAAIAQPLDTPLEGGDIALAPHRRLALMGHGVRTSAASARGLAAFLGGGYEVVPLRLVCGDLFHLDTALTVLADDTLVVCKAAFDRASLAALERLDFARVVAIPFAEARTFAVNVIELADGTIVTGTSSPLIDRVWRGELGRDVIVVPLEQFQLAGGSAACLAAKVIDTGIRARVAAAASAANRAA
jgi:N-dimethylarginine dimethylaminohydrolase